MSIVVFFKKAYKKIHNTVEDIILYKFPLKKTIVFECESDFDDNPRAVYEYLIENRFNRHYKLVWLVKDVEFCKKNYKKHNVVFISRFDKNKKNNNRLKYYLTTSKYFIFSHPYWFRKKRKEQVVVHVGHGTPLKGRTNIFDSSCIDWLLASSDNTIELYSKFWSCEEEKVFVCGLPRNDFFKSGIDRKAEIIHKLGFGNIESKFVVCMPTFKQSKHFHDSDIVDPYVLSVVENDEQLFSLNEQLRNNNIHLIVKIHPMQSLEHIVLNNLSNIHYLNNAELFSKQIILYELLGCTDALLTDFSSVAFDFLMLNRPIGFFLNNFSTYSRGYMMDNPLDYMPGEKIYDFSDFIKFITNLTQSSDDFENQRKKLCQYINGSTNFEVSNCEKFVNWLFNERR